MKLGLTLVIAILVICVGGVAWLALTDMPVHQQEITVNIPVSQ